jgi:hypothetical protein
MNALSHFWTFCLFPISLLGAIGLVIAFANRSWLLASSLAIALFFSFARLVGASRAYQHRTRLEESQAAIWQGEAIRVGAGLKQVSLSVGLFLCAAAVAVAFIVAKPSNLVAWGALLLIAVVEVLYMRRVATGPATLLTIDRHGVTDAKFGTVSWDHVADVRLFVVSVRSATFQWLELALTEDGRRAAATRQSEPVTGLPISRLEEGDLLRYQLQMLAVHPQYAHATAKALWQMHNQGSRPDTEPARTDAAQAGAALGSTKSNMRRFTQVAVTAYLLAPIALIADLMVRWPK